MRPIAMPLLLLLGVTRGDAAAETVVPVPARELGLRDSPVEAKRRLVRARAGTGAGIVGPGEPRIVPPAPGSDGDPTLHGATLTVYNAAGRPLAWSTALPAARWRINGSATSFKGWLFKDDTVADGPVFRVYVKSDKLFLIGGRDLFGYRLDDVPQERVAVRLALGTGVEFCLVASAKSSGGSTGRYDNAARFVGERAPAPAPCPAVP